MDKKVIGADKEVKQLKENIGEMSQQLAKKLAIVNIASTYAVAIEHFSSKTKDIEKIFQEFANNNGKEFAAKMKENFKNEIAEVNDNNEVLDAREEKTIFTKMGKNLQKLWGKTVKNDAKNVLKDKSISKNFKEFNKTQIAHINDAIGRSMEKLDKYKIIKFFKIPVIRYILYHSIFSKFKKTFIKYTDKISDILMELTNATGTVRLGKTLGSKVRDALYQKKDLFSSLTILVGLAYRKKSKNIEKIKNDTVNHLNSITKKLKEEAEVNANEFENKFDDCQNANDVIEKLNKSYGLIVDYCELGFVTGKDGIDALTKMLKACGCFKKIKIKSLDKSDGSSVSNILDNIGKQINKLELNTNEKKEKENEEKEEKERKEIEKEAKEFIENMADLREYWNKADEKVNEDETIKKITEKIEEMENDAKNGIKKEIFNKKIEKLRNMINNIKNEEIKGKYYKTSEELLNKIEKTYNEASEKQVNDIFDEVIRKYEKNE